MGNKQKNVIKLVIGFCFSLIFLACGGGSNSEDVIIKTNSTNSDTSKPIITLVGDAKVALIEDTVYIDAGATANDDKDGDITANIRVNSSVDTNSVGTYTVTYDVGDSSGNDATQIVRTVVITNGTESYIPTELTNSTAQKFLLMSTFGPTEESIDGLKEVGIVGWLEMQLNAPSAYDSNSDSHYTYLERSIDIVRIAYPARVPESTAVYVDTNNNISINQGGTEWRVLSDAFTSTWHENAFHSKDQLRQRMAYALSQILVVSSTELTFTARGEALSTYYDILAKHAFGNYRDLLFHVTKSAAMGVYLTSRGSKKYDAETKRQPDENYAREVMQLFSLGLNKLELNGNLMLDQNGKPIPTYTQTDVEEMARVFTGWDLAEISNYSQEVVKSATFTKPMEFTAQYHDFGSKNVLGTTIAGVGGDEELRAVVEMLVSHPNTAPFVSKQLIQRFVTSNPTPEYILRVSNVFRDNGKGVSGDMKSVIKAILLDKEVFASRTQNEYFGKAKEPLLAFVQLLIAFDVEYATPWPGRVLGSSEDLRDVYLFKRSQRDAFGQGPLMAPSVFNFYQSDFIANDPQFKNNGKVTPELQIQSPQQLINYSNRLRVATYLHERLRKALRIEVHGETLTSHVYDRYTIGFEEESEILKQIFENDYTRLSQSPYKEDAVEVLVDKLNEKLTFNQMNDEEVSVLKAYLKNKGYGSSYENSQGLILDAVNAVATSKSYMIQK